MEVTDALKYIISLSQVLGIFPYRLKRSVGGTEFEVSTALLTYSKVLFSGFVFGVGIYTFWTSSFIAKNFHSLQDLTSMTIVMLSTLISCISLPILGSMVLFRKRLLCFWLNRIKSLFPNLSEAEINKLQVTSAMCVSFAVGGFLLMILAEWVIPQNSVQVVQNLSSLRGRFVAYVSVLVFYAVVVENKTFVQHFLIHVNMIRVYYMKTNEELTSKGAGKPWRERVEYINRLRKRDLEMQDFIRFLHTFFIPIVSLQLSWGFYSVLFNMVMNTKFETPALLQTIWAAYISWDFLSVCFLCYSAEKEAQKTVQLVQDCFINCDSGKLREEVELFSLQVQHQKVEFYLTGLIKLDLSLIYTVIGALISYTVIYLQFNEAFSGENSSGDFCHIKCGCQNATFFAAQIKT